MKILIERIIRNNWKEPKKKLQNKLKEWYKNNNDEYDKYDENCYLLVFIYLCVKKIKITC